MSEEGQAILGILSEHLVSVDPEAELLFKVDALSDTLDIGPNLLAEMLAGKHYGTSVLREDGSVDLAGLAIMLTLSEHPAAHMFRRYTRSKEFPVPGTEDFMDYYTDALVATLSVAVQLNRGELTLGPNYFENFS